MPLYWIFKLYLNNPQNIHCWLRRQVFKDFSNVFWATIFWQNVKRSYIIHKHTLPPDPNPAGVHLANFAFPAGILLAFFILVSWHSGVSKYLKDDQIPIIRLILVHFNLKSKYMSDCTFRKRKWHHEIKGPRLPGRLTELTLSGSGQCFL